MSTRVGFYHLQRTGLDQALPRLLEKALGTGQRVVVMAGSAERVAFLDSLLWTWEPDSWLPHGTARDGDQQLQPIFLTERDENPNGAQILVLLDGVVSERMAEFSRCLTLFDGNDEAAVATSRLLWKEWKNLGFDLTYYQQTERGGWQEKARANAPDETGAGGAGGETC